MSLWELKCEHERLQNEVSQLADMLENTSAEKEQAMMMYKESYIRESRMKHNNGLLEKESKALSHQVQTLLSEIEIYQGKKKFNSIAKIQNASSVNCEPLIFDQLTPFRDIQELQNQNQKLLSLIHELSSRFEAEENNLNEKIKSLESSLTNDARKLIEELKNCIEQQDSKNKRLTAEKKVLLQLAKVSPDVDILTLEKQFSSEPADTTSDNIYCKKLEELLEIKNNELSQSLKSFQKQLEEISAERDVLKIRISQSEAQLNPLKDSLSFEKSEKSKYFEEKQQLSQLCENIKNEFSCKELLLKETQLKEARLKSELQDSRSSFNYLNEDHKNLKKNYMELESHCNDLTSQISCLEEELSLFKEREISQNKLTQSLHDQIAQNLNSFKKERKELNTKLDKAQERLLAQSCIQEKNTIDSFSHINLLTDQLNSSHSKTKELELSLADNIKENNTLKEKNDQLVALLQSSTSGEESFQADLCNQILELKSQLQNSLDDISQFQSISQAAEDTLADFKSELQERELNFEKELRHLRDELSEYKKRDEMHAIENKNQQKEVELRINSLQEQFRKDKLTLESEISRLTSLHTKALESNEAYKEAAVAAQNNTTNQSTEDGNSLTHESQRLLQEIADYDKKLKEQLAEYKSYVARSQEKENTLLHQIKEQEENIIELKQLSDNLLENYQGINNEIESTQDFDSTQEIVRFLRQEKELAESRLQISRANQARLETELDAANKSLAQARKFLNDEKSKGTQMDQLINLKTLLQNEESKASSLRKDNVILQEEVSSLISKLQILSSEFETTKAQLKLNQEQLSEIQAGSELKQREVALLEEDNQRCQIVIQKLQSKNPQLQDSELLQETNNHLQNEILNLKLELEKLQTETKEKSSQAKEKFEAMDAKRLHYYKVAMRFKNLLDKSKESSDKNPVDEEVLQKQINDLTQVNKNQINILNDLRKILELPEGNEEFVEYVNKLKSTVQESEKMLNTQKESYIQLQAALRRNQKALDLTKARLKTQETKPNSDNPDIQFKFTPSSENKSNVLNKPMFKTNSVSLQIATPIQESGRSRSVPPEEGESLDNPTKKLKSPDPITIED